MTGFNYESAPLTLATFTDPRMRCLDKPDAYDVLIESDRNTPGRRVALAQAVGICMDCPVRTQCLAVVNADEQWAQMISAALWARAQSKHVVERSA